MFTLIFANFLGSDGGSVYVVHLDESLDKETLKDYIIEVVEKQTHHTKCITEMDGDWVNVIVLMSKNLLPTNDTVYGLSSIDVHKWDQMDPSTFWRVACLSHGTVENNVMFCGLHTKSALYGHSDGKCSRMAKRPYYSPVIHTVHQSTNMQT